MEQEGAMWFSTFRGVGQAMVCFLQYYLLNQRPSSELGIDEAHRDVYFEFIFWFIRSPIWESFSKEIGCPLHCPFCEFNYLVTVKPFYKSDIYTQFVDVFNEVFFELEEICKTRTFTPAQIRYFIFEKRAKKWAPIRIGLKPLTTGGVIDPDTSGSEFHCMDKLAKLKPQLPLLLEINPMDAFYYLRYLEWLILSPIWDLLSKGSDYPTHCTFCTIIHIVGMKDKPFYKDDMFLQWKEVHYNVDTYLYDMPPTFLSSKMFISSKDFIYEVMKQAKLDSVWKAYLKAHTPIDA